MRLLICTQTVDSHDSYLGFFVRWLEEFAKHCEEVHVVCLREGTHVLPAHVHIHQLQSKNKFARTIELWRLCVRLRYERVLVHMNPEYLVAAGWLWRILGRKVALWYMHKQVDFKLRVAEKFARAIFTASKESFRLPSAKLRILGHGIDTDFFSPSAQSRGQELLSVGRLSASKRHDLVLRAAQRGNWEVWIAGEGPEFDALQALAEDLEITERVRWLGGRTQEQLRELYQRCGVLVHTSETGSLDKVVLEALACGMPVVSTSDAYKTMLEPHGLYVQGEPNTLASAIENTFGKNVSTLTSKVQEKHSLKNLIPAILAGLA